MDESEREGRGERRGKAGGRRLIRVGVVVRVSTKTFNAPRRDTVRVWSQHHVMAYFPQERIHASTQSRVPLPLRARRGKRANKRHRQHRLR